jgi:hypothetical protein
LLASAAEAAEIKVLASVALTSALNELAPQFERTTGNKLALGYSLVADIRKRVLEGETADVIILSRPVMDELQKQDKFAPGTIADVAGIAVAVTVRAGAPKPDISSADALKRSLLAARSIVYADPAKGGLSGVYFARVLDRLGIAEQVKSKTILVPGDQSADVVAKGEAEIGVPACGGRAIGRPPARRLWACDRLLGRNRGWQQGARGGNIAHWIPHRTERRLCAQIQRNGSEVASCIARRTFAARLLRAAGAPRRAERRTNRAIRGTVPKPAPRRPPADTPIAARWSG